MSWRGLVLPAVRRYRNSLPGGDDHLETVPAAPVQEWPLVVLFGLVSQLGDVWFLLLLGGVLSVVGDERPVTTGRRRGVFVFALGVASVALTEALKPVFAHPRPPGAATPPAVPWLPSAFGPLLDSLTTAESFGFPSGHALGSAMVWGGLALVLDRGTRRQRLGVAGAVVAAVSASRLALGVHDARDVVAGAALGIVALAVLYRVSERGTRPERVFLTAAVVGAAGLLVAPTFDGVLATGGAVGGWVAWHVADATPARPPSDWVTVAVLGAAAGLFGVVYLLEPPPVPAFLGTAVATGGVVGAPTLAERLTRR